MTKCDVTETTGTIYGTTNNENSMKTNISGYKRSVDALKVWKSKFSVRVIHLSFGKTSLSCKPMDANFFIFKNSNLKFPLIFSIHRYPL